MNPCCTILTIGIRTLKILSRALCVPSHWILIPIFVRAALAAFTSACIATASTSRAARKVVAESVHTALSAWRNTCSPATGVTCSTQKRGAAMIHTLDALILVALCVLSHRILIACGWSHATFAVGVHACITTAFTPLSAAKQITSVVCTARACRAAIPAAVVLRRTPENIVLVVEARLCTWIIRNILQHRRKVWSQA